MCVESVILGLVCARRLGFQVRFKVFEGRHAWFLNLGGGLKREKGKERGFIEKGEGVILEIEGQKIN